MKLFEFSKLTEYKIMKLDHSGEFGDFPIYQNPSFLELKRILAEEQSMLRGWTDEDQNVYLWGSLHSEHHSVASYFLSSIPFEDRFVIGSHKNLEEWEWIAVKLYPNIWMAVSTENIIKSSKFNRMVKLSYDELKGAIMRSPEAAKVMFGSGEIHPMIDRD